MTPSETCARCGHDAGPNGWGERYQPEGECAKFIDEMADGWIACECDDPIHLPRPPSKEGTALTESSAERRE